MNGPNPARAARLLALVLATLLVLPATPVRAWGSLGHCTVWEIARRHLTPAAAAEVEKILGSPHSCEDVSIWADMVKGSRPETRPWHYINFEKDAKEPTPGELDIPEGNSYMAMMQSARRIVQPDADEVARREALYFIVHLVGDCHQPLHNGYAEDLGGNRVRVPFGGGGNNLHAVWDSSMLGTMGLDHMALADQLLAEATGEEMALLTAESNPLTWIVEGRALVHSDVYATLPTDKNENLDGAYTAHNLPIARKQVLRGGLRLAAWLNYLLDPASRAEADAGSEAVAAGESPADATAPQTAPQTAPETAPEAATEATTEPAVIDPPAVDPTPAPAVAPGH